MQQAGLLWSCFDKGDKGKDEEARLIRAFLDSLSFSEIAEQECRLSFQPVLDKMVLRFSHNVTKSLCDALQERMTSYCAIKGSCLETKLGSEEPARLYHELSLTGIKNKEELAELTAEIYSRQRSCSVM